MAERNKDLLLLILDMQAIEDRLREFERKYRLRSSEFCRLVREGKIEQRLELVEWLGLCEILQAREAEYRKLLEQQAGPVLAGLNDMPIPA
ncbi:hypothetical protein ACFLTC_00155 [Chloroflexota bacterium]